MKKTLPFFTLCFLGFLAGCCSVFHIDCPQQDYWTVTDNLAKHLNDRYGSANWEIVPLPLGDYPIGTTLSKGHANGFACVCPSDVVSNFPADYRLATESNIVSVDLSLASPTNISQFTAGFNMDYSKRVYMSYSHMTLAQVSPNYFREIFFHTNSQCRIELNLVTQQEKNTMIIVGYLKGQFQISQTGNFDIDLNAAAYGANGKIAYTNAGGWTVLTTNSVNCFAIVSRPQLISETLEVNAIGFDVEGLKVYKLNLVKPNHRSALNAVKP
jgi:hypothetical protein